MQQLVQKEKDRAKESMLKHGPKDEAYASLFTKKDIELVQKLFRKKDSRLIDEFMDKTIAKYNDHNPVLKVGNHDIEFIQVAKAEDLPTFPGLIHCNNLAFGTLSNRWRYMGAGNDSREARPYQQRLFGETEPRADMTQAPQGSATRSGNALRFIGIFPASFPTITVRESGVFNVVTAYAGKMLNRNVFASTPITHVVNVLGFTLASLLTFTGV
jgi:hypothetical protein